MCNVATIQDLVSRVRNMAVFNSSVMAAFCFGIVPDNDLGLRPAWVLASAYYGQIVISAHHLRAAHAGVEITRYLELARVRIEDTESGVQSNNEARGIVVEGR